LRQSDERQREPRRDDEHQKDRKIVDQVEAHKPG
jgi:hypothetical protein